ncbi:phage holin family protein [Anaerococcus sp.]|uniref:phage holin family protein n=1 Tax=Anaerococcus sp. TaxID=1872515 RepID=UPI0037C0E4C2
MGVSSTAIIFFYIANEGISILENSIVVISSKSLTTMNIKFRRLESKKDLLIILKKYQWIPHIL